jgi:hypothetical protein
MNWEKRLDSLSKILNRFVEKKFSSGIPIAGNSIQLLPKITKNETGPAKRPMNSKTYCFPQCIVRVRETNGLRVRPFSLDINDPE